MLKAALLSKQMMITALNKDEHLNRFIYSEIDTMLFGSEKACFTDEIKVFGTKPPSIHDMIAYADVVYVVTKDIRIVGCVAIDPFHGETKYMRCMCIAASARSQNLGSTLLRFVLKEHPKLVLSVANFCGQEKYSQRSRYIGGLPPITPPNEAKSLSKKAISEGNVSNMKCDTVEYERLCKNTKRLVKFYELHGFRTFKIDNSYIIMKSTHQE